MDNQAKDVSRRQLLKKSAFAIATTSVASSSLAGVHESGSIDVNTDKKYTHPFGELTKGPIGFTSFIHPSAELNLNEFEFGAVSFIDAFVSLNGHSAKIGNAVNLQANDRLIDYNEPSNSYAAGDLVIGDGSFSAHGVTFIGKVRVGEACGMGFNAVIQNARIGNASFVGLGAQILGYNPDELIEVPDASLVLFGARIRQQADVAANTIPVPAPFTLFIADVNQENLVLARGYNLLYRAVARMTPFSGRAGDPRNPGDKFPDVASAFGKISIAPPSVYRRGNGVLKACQAGLSDPQYAEDYEGMWPVAKFHYEVDASGSPEAGARFIKPRVASPELIDDKALVLGGCDLAEGVTLAPRACVLGDVAPTVSIGRNTSIGSNTSVNELAFTSCSIGEQTVIGKRCVLHGPLEVGNNVIVGDGVILFGPKIADGITIGDNALIFGPVEITEDVPANAIIVAKGNEFLIAPSAPTIAQSSMPCCDKMVSQWRSAQIGSGCSCGLGHIANISAAV